MWIPWNEWFLPNTNGQWNLLPKDLLHVMYIFDIWRRLYNSTNGSLYSWNFLQFDLKWPYGMLTLIKSLKLIKKSGWGTALAMPLAFPKGLLYLNRCLCFFCMLQCRKTIAGCGELSQHQTRQKWTCQPQLSHFPGILLSRTDEAKLNWP